MKKADALLLPVIRRLGIEDSVRLTRIRNDWRHIFDAPIVLHMFPAKLMEGALTLNVDSPIWMQQLSYCKKEIVGKLSAYGIKDVRFRLGKVSWGNCSSPPVRNIATLSSEDACFIAGLTSGISDEALKNAVKAAAEKSLRSPQARQK